MRQQFSSPNIRALLALNAAMLAVLAAVTFGSSASAQARARGEYTMVAGGAPGASAGVVYIVDSINQDLMAIVYNQNTKQLDGVAYQNLGADAQAVLRGRTQPGR